MVSIGDKVGGFRANTGNGQPLTEGHTCSSLCPGKFQAAGRDPRTPTRPCPRAGSGPPGNARCSSRPSPNTGSQASRRSRRPAGTDTPRWRLREDRRVKNGSLQCADRHSRSGRGRGFAVWTEPRAKPSAHLSAKPRPPAHARRARPRRGSASRGSPKAWASQGAWGQTRGRTASSVSSFPLTGSSPTTSCKRPSLQGQGLNGHTIQPTGPTGPTESCLTLSRLLSLETMSWNKTGTGWPSLPDGGRAPGRQGPRASAPPAGSER